MTNANTVTPFFFQQPVNYTKEKIYKNSGFQWVYHIALFLLDV